MVAAAGIAGLVVVASAVTVVTSSGAAGVGGPFRLVADDGRSVSERSFPGKFLLVYFGYTSCRDVCPATMTTLGAAVDRLGAASSRVQPLFITLDPERDTPDVLGRYVAAFGGHLVGLSGSQAALRNVADEYRVDREIHPGAGSVTIDHSSVIYMMSPDGRFVAAIPAGASEMVMSEAILRRLE